jgi:hypothetical protein
LLPDEASLISNHPTNYTNNKEHPNMDPLNEKAENSVMGKGSDGIPNDGTGKSTKPIDTSLS